MSKKIKPPKPPAQPAGSKKTQAKKNIPTINKKMLWIIPGIISAITFIVFYPALKNGFVNWDDGPYVLENFILMSPLSQSIKYFFGQHYFVGNYQPVTMTVYALIYNASQLNPAAYHAVSLCIHLLNAALVFWFIYLLSGKKIEVATIVSFFFAVHPMHVESVVWVAELKDVLYTFFFISGLIAYYKYCSNIQSKSFFLLPVSFLLFVISGLSKPAAVTFPLTILLIDFYTNRKMTLKVWLEKIPFFIYAVVIGIITLKAQQHDKALADLNHFSIVQRFMLSSFAMLDYPVKLLAPYRLSALNPFPQLVNNQLPVLYFITPFIALAVLILVFRSLKKTKLIAFGFLFYLANIALVLQFLSVGLAITSDRYSYVPYIGLLFIIGMGYNNLSNFNDNKSKLYKTLATGAMIIYAVVFLIMTNSRVKTWNNSEVLWTDVISKYPNDYFAYGNRGVYYHSLKKNDIALNDFNMAIKLNPKYSLGYNNRGNIYTDMGNDSLAIENYNKAILYDSTTAKNFTNRATSYGRVQKYDLALKDFDKAIQLDPNYHMIYYNRSIYYSISNQHEKELADINKYLSLKPDDHEMYNARGVCYQSLGKYNESLADFTKAVELKPSVGVYWLNRSYSENQLGQKDQARNDALKAQQLGVQLNPEYAKLMGL